MKWAFAAALALAITTPALAKDGKAAFGITVNFGETWNPNHYRLRLKAVDLGYEWRSDLHYAASRLWKNGYYAGLGGGVRLTQAAGGLVGIVGKEWVHYNVLGISVEGFAVAGSRGLTMALGTLGLSLVW